MKKPLPWRLVSNVNLILDLLAREFYISDVRKVKKKKRKEEKNKKIALGIP